MSDWPTTGPDFNKWNNDVEAFTSQISKSRNFWLTNSQLKYLEIRVDTRSGNFLLYDRDGNRISPDRVLAAIRGEADHG